MSRYQFELATTADDADLRALLRETPMPGSIAVTMQREPSYFDAVSIDGDFRQVIVCRDTQTGRVIGGGVRSVREMYVNGMPTTVGYLSALRLLPNYRNRGLVARGYRVFRKLHADGRAPMYLTTIAKGNTQAVSVLTSGRAQLPAYHPAGRFCTLAIPIPRRVGRSAGKQLPKDIQIRSAERSDLKAVVQFLHEVGAQRQFFPRYKEADFALPKEGCSPTFKNLPLTSLLLAFRGSQLVGVLGGWDQHAFRQTIVHAYGPSMRWIRRLYNLWATCRNQHSLPAVGQEFRCLLAAIPIVEPGDSSVLVALLNELLGRAAKGPCGWLLIGLHESDSLLPVVQRRAVTSYDTELFHVCWDDGEAFRKGLDGRTPYLELGCL